MRRRILCRRAHSVEQFAEDLHFLFAPGLSLSDNIHDFTIQDSDGRTHLLSGILIFVRDCLGLDRLFEAPDVVPKPFLQRSAVRNRWIFYEPGKLEASQDLKSSIRLFCQLI